MMNVLFQFHWKSDFSRWCFFVFAASFALMFISCSDLQKESSTSACNSALNQQNWDTAISTCTSSKGLGDAYMGKGGFNITNLLNNSGGETTPSHISGANTSNLGTVDSTGATIMYILGIAFSQVSDDTTRGAKIASAKSAFDSASSSYAGVIASDKDAALMYTFANVFAMQLGQSILYDAGDNGAQNSTPSNCGTNYSNSETGIKKYDGYLWTAEKNKTQCSASSYSSMCSDLSSTISYITKIKDGLSKSGSSTSSSNTQVISNSQTAVCTMMKAINTADSSGDPCDVSDCP